MGLFDDSPGARSEVMGYSVKNSIDDFPKECEFFVAVGDNRTRKRLFEEMLSLGRKPARIIHPSAVISRFAQVGDGTIVCAGAVVGVNAEVGRNAIVNTGATVDHGCFVGAHSHLAVGVHMAGQSRAEEGAFLGAGAVTVPRVSVGAWSVVGAGAAVTKDVAAGVTAVGVPAKVIRAEAVNA